MVIGLYGPVGGAEGCNDDGNGHLLLLKRYIHTGCHTKPVARINDLIIGIFVKQGDLHDPFF